MHSILTRFNILACVALLALLAACSGAPAGGDTQPEDQPGISISAADETVAPEATLRLRAALSGSGASEADIHWSATAGQLSPETGAEVDWTLRRLQAHTASPRNSGRTARARATASPSPWLRLALAVPVATTGTRAMATAGKTTAAMTVTTVATTPLGMTATEMTTATGTAMTMVTITAATTAMATGTATVTMPMTVMPARPGRSR